MATCPAAFCFMWRKVVVFVHSIGKFLFFVLVDVWLGTENNGTSILLTVLSFVPNLFHYLCNVYI